MVERLEKSSQKESFSNKTRGNWKNDLTEGDVEKRVAGAQEAGYSEQQLWG